MHGHARFKRPKDWPSWLFREHKLYLTWIHSLVPLQSIIYNAIIRYHKHLNIIYREWSTWSKCPFKEFSVPNQPGISTLNIPCPNPPCSFHRLFLHLMQFTEIWISQSLPCQNSIIWIIPTSALMSTRSRTHRIQKGMQTKTFHITVQNRGWICWWHVRNRCWSNLAFHTWHLIQFPSVMSNDNSYKTQGTRTCFIFLHSPNNQNR